MTRSARPDASEKKAFLEGWLDYVVELGGAEDAEEAWASYRDERRHLLQQLAAGPLTVYRMMVLDASTDLAALVGDRRSMGRFWTSDRSVAGNWHGRSEYSGVPIPEDGVEVILEASISVDDIDIVETVACRLGANWEQEVRIAGDMPVMLVSVEPKVISGPVPLGAAS